MEIQFDQERVAAMITAAFNSLTPNSFVHPRPNTSWIPKKSPVVSSSHFWTARQTCDSLSPSFPTCARDSLLSPSYSSMDWHHRWNKCWLAYQALPLWALYRAWAWPWTPIRLSVPSMLTFVKSVSASYDFVLKATLFLDPVYEILCSQYWLSTNFALVYPSTEWSSYITSHKALLEPETFSQVTIYSPWVYLRSCNVILRPCHSLDSSSQECTPIASIL